MATSGQKTVTTAGTAVQLSTTEECHGPLRVKALDTNTNPVAIGNDGAGDVTVSNGLRLDTGESVDFEYVEMLSDLWLDSVTNGEGVSWIKLKV